MTHLFSFIHAQLGYIFSIYIVYLYARIRLLFEQSHYFRSRLVQQLTLSGRCYRHASRCAGCSAKIDKRVNNSSSFVKGFCRWFRISFVRSRSRMQILNRVAAVVVRGVSPRSVYLHCANIIIRHWRCDVRTHKYNRFVI